LTRRVFRKGQAKAVAAERSFGRSNYGDSSILKYALSAPNFQLYLQRNDRWQSECTAMARFSGSAHCYAGKGHKSMNRSLAGYNLPTESFEYDFEVSSQGAAAVRVDERVFIKTQIAANQRDPYKLTDAVFYLRHPELNGKRLGTEQTDLTKEWLSILHNLVERVLKASGAQGAQASSPDGASAGDTDVTAAQAIARKPVPGMAGITIQQLIERWRPSIAPEIPLPLLLGFMRFESGGNFNDATHGSPRNQPPYTQPAFYELGLFQTPAGLHGTCTTGDHRSCANAPPGREVPGDPSTWARLCKKIGANPQDWTNPTTQVRVGLLDLKTSADAIRAAYPGLFPKPGGDWYLRMAVLMPFARGGGFTRAFLRTYRANLAKLPEDQRWDFLRGKRVSGWIFDASNVDKKMLLAAKLG
jgi:hypothetical protein